MLSGLRNTVFLYYVITIKTIKKNIYQTKKILTKKMFQIIENTGNDCICWTLNNLQQLNHSVNNSVIWNYILLITLTGGFIYTWYELRVMRKRINTLEGKKNVPLIIGLKCFYYELINKIKK